MSTADDILAYANECAARIATDPTTVDPVEAGALGSAVLDAAGEPAERHTTTAITLLHHALTAAADHPDAAEWAYNLGASHALHAEARFLGTKETAEASLPDWDAAVHWFDLAVRQTLASVTPRVSPIEVVDGMILDLAAVRRDRTVAQIAAGDGTPEVRDRLAWLLTDDLEPLVQQVHTAGARATITGIIGLCWEERYLATSAEHALSAAVDALSLSVVDLPDTDFAAHVNARLAELLHRRYFADRDMATLDDAVAAAERAVELSTQDDEDFAYHHWVLGNLLDTLLDAVTEPDQRVRDRAIESLTIALGSRDGERDDPDTAGMLGLRIAERGQSMGDAGELRRAIPLLRVAAEAGDDLLGWSTLTIAWAELAELTGDEADWAEVITSATTALTNPVHDPDLVLDQVRLRVTALNKVSGGDAHAAHARYPILEWMREGVELILTAAADERTDRLMLALCAGLHALFDVGQSAVVSVMSSAGFAEMVDRVQPVLALAEHDELDEPDWTATIATLNETVATVDSMVLNRVDRSIRDELVSRLAAVNDPEVRDALGSMASMLAGMRAAWTGNLNELRLLERGVAPSGVSGPPTAKDQANATAMAGLASFLRVAMTRPSRTERAEWLAQLDELMESLDGYSSRDASELMMVLLAAIKTIDAAERSGVLPEETPPTRLTGAMHLAWRLVVVIAKLILAGRGAAMDVPSLAEEVAAVRTSIDPAQDTVAFLIEALLAIADTRLVSLAPLDRGNLDRAIAGHERVLADYRRNVPTQVDAHAKDLGRLLRTRGERGDRARSRELAIEAMSSLAWRVLVQSGTVDAVTMARGSTAETDEFLTWCVEDNAHDDLVRIVEAQRGLVLHAANTNRDVATRLRDLGAEDLAAAWEATSGDRAIDLPGLTPADVVPTGLRARVLRRLGDTLLRPPNVPEIQQALGVHGSDVLIYLVPPSLGRSAYAVAVPRDGTVQVTPLPHLAVGRGSPLADYVVAYNRWQEAEKGSPKVEARAAWAVKIAELCDWAGGAAGAELGRLAREYAPRARTPRVVLTPMGVLGMIPWHAVRVATGTGPRHLLQDVCVSYTPSARMLSEVASRVPVVGQTVLVGDPAETLYHGGFEAKALYDSFYQKAVFLGGVGETIGTDYREEAPDGIGTPAEVTSLLSQKLALIHFACHAEAIMATPHESYLELAGWRGPQNLTVNAMLELNPTGELTIGTAVLPGCTTSLFGHDYDEALSLSSTFLVIGARSVVGTLWPVPDTRNTVCLSYQFHRNLVAGMPVAEALRQAQLWMLDQNADHVGIPDMITDLDPATAAKEDIAEWAAFLHMGA